MLEISGDFEEILIRNSTKNIFGKDLSDEIIEWEHIDDDEKVTKGKMNIGKAIFSNMNSLITQFGPRSLMPSSLSLSAPVRATDRNSERIRDFFLKHLNERIAEKKINPQVEEKFDFLNLMLDSEDGLYDTFGILSQIADIFIAST
jgi:hypothetical protein